MRVLVPFGGRRMIGVVTGAAGGRRRARPQGGRPGPRREPARPAAAARPRGVDGRPLPGAARGVLPDGPAAGGRAGEPRRRAPREARARAREDPVVQLLGGGPLRLTALEKRLGQDPQARVARLRRAGVVAVDQEIGAPGFREARVAVLGDAAIRAEGAGAGRGARAPARGRGARPRGRPRARPPLPARDDRPPRRERGADARRRAGRAGAGGAAGPRHAGRDAHPGPGDGARAPPGGGGGGGVPPLPAVRGHGQRKDGGVLPGRRGGPVSRPGCPRPRARDRAHPDARARRAGALRDDRVRAPQRARGGRAARPVVAHPRGRGARRGRRALRGLRPGARPGPARGGRGARRLLQAGREPALPRAGRRGHAGAARGLPGRARLGDAVGRVARERPPGQVREARPPGRASGRRACPGSRSWTSARCSRRGATRS